MKHPLLGLILVAAAGCSTQDGATGELAADQLVSSGLWISLDLADGSVAAVGGTVDPADPRWQGTTLLFRQIVPGAATIGRPVADPLAEVDEYPRRDGAHGRVWICAHELNQLQWRMLSGDEPWYGVLPVADLGAYVGDRLPAVGMTPLQAETACESFHTDGWTVSLPEALEWELACTGGRASRFAWGDALETDEAAAQARCAADAPIGCGSLAGNDWGMHDMHGNAWEMVRGDYGWEARGGAWDQPLLTARSTNRMALEHDSAGWSLGLRLVLRR
ncbi:MAG: SUMF1/EgtB/PvdO family nonheme iron enzyme [Planctomycetes bacterium]|nr:SUMF1/EgtB/PvdO family nonheme iron enzyme [Planctomycetota bacterium]